METVSLDAWKQTLAQIAPVMEGLRRDPAAPAFTAEEARAWVDAFRSTPRYQTARAALRVLMDQMVEPYLHGDEAIRREIRAAWATQPRLAWMVNDLVGEARREVRPDALTPLLAMLSMAEPILNDREQTLTLRQLYAQSRDAGHDPRAAFERVAAISAQTHPYGLEPFRAIALSVINEFESDDDADDWDPSQGPPE